MIDKILISGFNPGLLTLTEPEFIQLPFDKLNLDTIYSIDPNSIIVYSENTDIIFQLFNSLLMGNNNITKFLITTNHYSRVVQMRAEANGFSYCTLDQINDEYISSFVNDSPSINKNKTMSNINILNNRLMINREFINIYNSDNDLSSVIFKILTLLKLICNIDIAILVIYDTATTSSKAYILQNTNITIESFDDFFNFCYHDHFINYNIIDYQKIEKFFFEKTPSTSSSNDLNESKFIKSYFYTPVLNNSGSVIGTLHLGNFINNYFSSSNFIGAIQDFNYKSGVILDKVLNNYCAKSSEIEIKTLFSKFVPFDVIEEIINEGRFKRKNEKKKVVILFSDIRSFTSITETNDAEKVIKFLNLYFHEMVTSIKEYGGVIDKFIGDAIVAIFEEKDNINIADTALQAAVLMLNNQKKIELNDIAIPITGFRIGIGLHLGEVIAGNIGSNEKTAYTVVGKTTGVAENLEGLTKKFNTEILFSDELFNHLDTMKKYVVKVEDHIYKLSDNFQLDTMIDTVKGALISTKIGSING